MNSTIRLIWLVMPSVLKLFPANEGLQDVIGYSVTLVHFTIYRNLFIGLTASICTEVPSRVTVCYFDHLGRIVFLMHSHVSCNG